MDQCEAKDKFMNIPELIERLISFLDPLSALSLLQSKVIDKKILQKSLSCEAWKKLIRRSSYDGEGLLQAEDVKDLVKILKLLEHEDPGTFLLPLLHLICESRPSKPFLSWVQVICPNHGEPHTVTPDAFLLLEEVEAAFGTTVQSIKSIWTCDAFVKNEKNYGPLCSKVPAFPGTFFLATSSRMSRQKEVVTSICVEGDILINNESSAQAFATLFQAQEVGLECSQLRVGGAVREKGWKELARAMQSLPNPAMHGRVHGVEFSISKEALATARRDDIEDVVGIFGDLEVFNKKDKLPVETHDWNQTWARLTQISDMTEDEFTAECDWAEERRIRREEEGIYTSDEEEYEEDESEGEESMDELEEEVVNGE